MNEPLKTSTKETAGIARRVMERREKAPNVTVKMVDGVARLSIGEKNQADDHLRLVEAMGSYDLEFLSPLLSQIGNSISDKGGIDEASLQFAISFIKSIEPKSEVETMLAAQMATTHVCGLDASRRYMHSNTLAGKDSAERAMTKLTRTFTMQMDALKKYRAKAQQTVRVERVTVNEGGQAIVGDVTHGGGGGGVHGKK
jgi:hypothetical protein